MIRLVLDHRDLVLEGLESVDNSQVQIFTESDHLKQRHADMIEVSHNSFHVPHQVTHVLDLREAGFLGLGGEEEAEVVLALLQFYFHVFDSLLELVLHLNGGALRDKWLLQQECLDLLFFSWAVCLLAFDWNLV